MIRVSHQYHHITPDPQLGHRWRVLLLQASVALALGDNSTYNTHCNTVREEFAKWKNQAERQCSEKSHKNWLGGGETYMVVASDPLQSSTFSFYKEMFVGKSRNEIMQTYTELAKDNWQSLYSPIYSL